MVFDSAMVRSGLAGLALILIAGCAHQVVDVPPRSVETAPPDLVALRTVAPQIRQEMRYAGRHNFMGRPVAGYEAPECWLSRKAADSLAAIQKELDGYGLRIRVFDCYRPQAAVNDFVRWGQDLSDQKNKDMYYPRVPKSELFKRGYISAKSGHSRASTVDLSLEVSNSALAGKKVRGPLADGIAVDMGTPFDLFDAQSHTDDAGQSPDVQHNRRWLRELMRRHGWRNLPEEWWHYTLQDEPYPDRYFDIPVRKAP